MKLWGNEPNISKMSSEYTNNLLRPYDYNYYKYLIILIEFKNVSFKLGLCRKLYRQNIAHLRRYCLYSNYVVLFLNIK